MTVTRDSDTNTVIEFVKRLTMPIGTKIEVVGVWVWITFPEKPPTEIRKQIKDAGFRWVPTRPGKPWAHACGEFRRKGKGDPKDKYDTELVAV